MNHFTYTCTFIGHRLQSFLIKVEVLNCSRRNFSVGDEISPNRKVAHLNETDTG
jgi:hypothetical protein